MVRAELDAYTGSFVFPTVLDGDAVRAWLLGLLHRHGLAGLQIARELLAARVAEPAEPGPGEPWRPRYGRVTRGDGTVVPVVFHPHPEELDVFVARWAADESPVLLLAGDLIEVDRISPEQRLQLCAADNAQWLSPTGHQVRAVRIGDYRDVDGHGG